MMNEDRPASTLPYATPQAQPPRRLRKLPRSLAMTAVICGTLLIGTPSVEVCLLYGQSSYGIPDYIMVLLWVTGGVGFAMVLLGVFLVSPSNRKSRRHDPSL
jgi:hypothetical protein